MSLSVLFIDTVHSILWEKLEQNGYSCTDATTWSQEEIHAQIAKFDGVVIRSKFKIDVAFLNLATRLKFIARSGAGLENIDLTATNERNIHVFNSPEGNRDAVGEQAVGMLLSLFNKLNQANDQVRKGIWDREGNRGIEIKGKTVGIIGYGNMGKAFAQRLSGFDCNVLAYDKYQTNYDQSFAKESTIEEIQEQADILSFHTPLTDETKYYFNASFLAGFKKPIYVINTARGKVLETAALVNGLKSGKVLGACLDVLEFESSSFEQLKAESLPPAFNYLLNSNQVILSPHIAGWTVESYIKLSSFLAEKIILQFGRF